MWKGMKWSVVLVWLLVLAACSWDGLRRGVYEGATSNERDRQSTAGRPADDPPPTFEQYERYRTNDH